MTAQELETLLIERVKSFNLEKTAFDSLQTMLSENHEDPIGGYPPNEITFLFDGYQFLINKRYGEPVIKTRIGLYVENENYLDNLEPIGYYELETDLDGKILDDWFVTS